LGERELQALFDGLILDDCVIDEMAICRDWFELEFRGAKGNRTKLCAYEDISVDIDDARYACPIPLKPDQSITGQIFQMEGLAVLGCTISYLAVDITTSLGSIRLAYDRSGESILIVANRGEPNLYL